MEILALPLAAHTVVVYLGHEQHRSKERSRQDPRHRKHHGSPRCQGQHCLIRPPQARSDAPCVEEHD